MKDSYLKEDEAITMTENEIALQSNMNHEHIAKIIYSTHGNNQKILIEYVPHSFYDIIK